MMPASTGKENIHATGLVFEGKGLLLRGRPGAGKSFLALRLLELKDRQPPPARLVGDDRLDVSSTRDGLIMQGPRSLRGRIELFGFGILTRPIQLSAPVDLVVDLVDEPARMPEPEELRISLLGIDVARMPVPAFPLVDVDHQIMLISSALAATAAAQ